MNQDMKTVVHKAVRKYSRSVASRNFASSRRLDGSSLSLNGIDETMLIGTGMDPAPGSNASLTKEMGKTSQEPDVFPNKGSSDGIHSVRLQCALGGQCNTLLRIQPNDDRSLLSLQSSTTGNPESEELLRQSARPKPKVKRDDVLAGNTVSWAVMTLSTVIQDDPGSINDASDASISSSVVETNDDENGTSPPRSKHHLSTIAEDSRSHAES